MASTRPASYYCCIASAHTAEHERLRASEARWADWKAWGPYVADRAWGTVREDYSYNGDAWGAFTYDQSRARAYRWNEDGLGGWCNRYQNLCLSVALWNGRDSHLKERLFGLTNGQGNHGEDVKELYFHEDAVPSHAYMTMRYKYPFVYPYESLLAVNATRSRTEREFEVWDAYGPEKWIAGEFWDCHITYAKASEDDMLCRIRVTNKSGATQDVHVLPQIWFRNTWSWGYADERPTLQPLGHAEGAREVHATGYERHIGRLQWSAHVPASAGENARLTAPVRLLVTDNDTNYERLYGGTNASPHTKDAFHTHVAGDNKGGRGEARIKPDGEPGTKACAWVQLQVDAHSDAEVWLRLRLLDAAKAASDAHDEGNHGVGEPVAAAAAIAESSTPAAPATFDDFEAVVTARAAEADAFYSVVQPPTLSADDRRIQRQAWAGLLWSKMYYHYSVDLWLKGDPAFPPPPRERTDPSARNVHWQHLYANDVLSMPDKFEYPWFAAWDLAFHMVPLCVVDPEWAKRQLILLLREWYMHANGALPAYEYAFDDLNPPVHAWACWRVYRISKHVTGTPDLVFLERCFHKLLLNFSWWANRKDPSGANLFEGGFLGLDNIGVFDRSQLAFADAQLQQADATAWMAMYCGDMLVIAIELALHNRAYEDIATKFLEHFVSIAHSANGDVWSARAATDSTGSASGLWDEEDGFFYDHLKTRDGRRAVKVKSFVGLIPLFACCVIQDSALEKLPAFCARMQWFMRHRSHLIARHHATLAEAGGIRDDTAAAAGRDSASQAARLKHASSCRLLSFVTETQLSRILTIALDETRFLSKFGLRSMSKEYEHTPHTFTHGSFQASVAYESGESRSPMYGGNSSWRGPVWLPVNFMLIEKLQVMDRYYGDTFMVECPTGSGVRMSLWDVSQLLAGRLADLFRSDAETHVRPVTSDVPHMNADPSWSSTIPFYEYFDAESGRGCGASHQTGWTASSPSCCSSCHQHVARTEGQRSDRKASNEQVYHRCNSDKVEVMSLAT